jgi:VacB/RNase II family 3'-5' exoribonuclease
MSHIDLIAAAREEMIDHGFDPDIPADALHQAQAITPHPNGRDLTALPWSSIDNDDSRDLDQVEWAERVARGIRVLVGIADVSAAVAKNTPIDAYAGRQTTTVYAGARTFPMLPERLSTDLTSLSEGQDRAAVVIEFVVGPDGCIAHPAVYPATVRNCARLTYDAMGPWLEGKGDLRASEALQQQLRLQDDAARLLRQARDRMGALTFERKEVLPVKENGQIKDIATRASNRAAHLIEDFMIAANEVMARTLRDAGVSSIRRVVKAPERWPRIVELASRYNDRLPPDPDAKALNEFLLRRRQADPEHYPDVSLAVLKLMGSGEYVLMRPGDAAEGHFGLAAHDYTHSTAPNRRFSDLVTQRLLKAIGAAPPYTDEELDAIARNCTLKEDSARKVERAMTKRIAAAALAPRVGQVFSAVVTGVTPKGVFVRIVEPPVEGRLMRGEQGLDVGDPLQVRLLSTDQQRGYIDFGRE